MYQTSRNNFVNNCPEYSFPTKRLFCAVWEAFKGWGAYQRNALLADTAAVWGCVCPTAVHSVQLLPNRNALSPERFWVRVSLAVANSSPMNPIRISQVRMANFLFSFCCSFGLALLVHDVHECLNFPAVYRHFHIFLVVKFRKALIKVKAFFIGFRDFPDGNGKSLTPFRFNGQVRTYF